MTPPKFVPIDNFAIGFVLNGGAVRTCVSIQNSTDPKNNSYDEQTVLRDKLCALLNDNLDKILPGA